MMVGWIAVKQFAPDILPNGVYGAMASVIRSTGPAGQFGSALMISAAVCAMMSTADRCVCLHLCCALISVQQEKNVRALLVFPRFLPSSVFYVCAHTFDVLSFHPSSM